MVFKFLHSAKLREISRSELPIDSNPSGRTKLSSLYQFSKDLSFIFFRFFGKSTDSKDKQFATA